MSATKNNNIHDTTLSEKNYTTLSEYSDMYYQRKYDAGYCQYILWTSLLMKTLSQHTGDITT